MVKSLLSRPFDKGLFFKWLLANAVGVPIAAGTGGVVSALIIFVVVEFAGEPSSKFSELEKVGVTFIGVFLGGLMGVFGGGSALMLASVGGGRLIGETIGHPIIGPPVMGGLILAVTGAVIGIGQWVVLRPHLHQSAWWVLANIIGWTMAGIVLGFVVNPEDTVLSQNTFYKTVTSVGAFSFLIILGLVLGAVGGGVSGFLQWFILRWNSYQVRWWVGASLVGWAIGGALVSTVLGGGGAWLGGAIAGVITGIPLAWFLRHAPPET